MNLWELSALKAAEKIRDGQITSLDLVEACLERTGETDTNIGAWAFLDPDLARQQACAMDEVRQKGLPMGPLHGVPIGVGDFYDTADMPTAWGTKRHKHRQPECNANVVDKALEAGSVILGKTATTEFGLGNSVGVRNPHDAERSAGSASAGSAAGVAAGHIPLTIDSQTNGSLISSASLCGVYGFKPTRGLVSRRGCLQTSSMLNQAGVMGRTLEDVAVLADVLAGYDPADQTTHTRPKPQMLLGCRAAAPIEPSIAWFDLPFYDRLSDTMRGGLDALIESLGARVERLPTPRSFIDIVGHNQTVSDYEFCAMVNANPEVQQAQTDSTRAPILERGRGISDEKYQRALAFLFGSENFFASFFNDYDAIVAPSTLGEANEPRCGDSGDPICSVIWTFAGLPCISLPWLTGEAGLPAGVQLIGSAEQDDRLLRTAAWLSRYLFDDTAGDTQNQPT